MANLLNDEVIEPLADSNNLRPRTSTGFQMPAISPGLVACIAVVILAMGWTYAPNLQWLLRFWTNDPDYTHGFLVVPIAGVIFWKRWQASESEEPEVEVDSKVRRFTISSWWSGWVVVLASLVARVYFSERAMNWLESMTMLGVVIGLSVAGLGWRTMARVWPAYAFLLFLYPLPPQLNAMLSQPLQSLATWSACGILRLSGLWVMPEGNVILVGNERLEVAAACNGLSMLMSLAATIAAAASLIPMSNWKRAVLLLSIIPIALSSNVLRIAATAWCYYSFGAEVGSKYAHDAAGWLMMPTALVLVGLELLIMSWLIVESEEWERQSDRLGLSMIVGPQKPVDGSPLRSSSMDQSS